MGDGWIPFPVALFLVLIGVGMAPEVVASHCEPTGGQILPWPGWFVKGTISPWQSQVYWIRTTLPAPATASDSTSPRLDHPVAIAFGSSGEAVAVIMQVINEADCHISSQSLLPVVGGCLLPDDVPVCWAASIDLDGRTTWIEVLGDFRAPYTSADYAMVATAPLHHDLALHDELP